MGSMTGERRRSQARHTWVTVAPSSRGHPVEGTARPRQLPAGQRGPRDEADPVLLAVVDHVVGAPLAEVVLVLHADHRHDPAGRLDLFDGHLGQADLGHLALVAQFPERPELVVGGNRGVDPVQLEQVDAVDAQAGRLPSHWLRRYSGRPQAAHWPGPAGEPGLGGDLERIRIGVQRLTDQFLGHVGTVGVGGVDQVDAQLDGPAEDGDGRLSWSTGGPHTPGPVSCMVPNPSRWTVRLPSWQVPESSTIVPDFRGCLLPFAAPAGAVARRARRSVAPTLV